MPLVPETFCTCGQSLAEKAEFCPSCGRPLTEEALTRERVRNAAERVKPDETGADLPPSFGNPHALRASYWAGAAAAILSSLPYMLFLGWLIYPLAGAFSVRSFRRRSGRTATEGDGARLGLMTGVLAFALFMVFFAVNTLAIGSEQLSEAAEQFASQFEQSGQADYAQRLAAMFDNPGILAGYFLATLIFLFVLIAGFTTLGGVFGAKLLEDD